MKTNLDHFMLIVIIALILYNAVPLYLDNLIMEDKELLIKFSLMGVNTVYCFVSNYFYSKNNGLNLYLSILLGLLFLPTSFIFYDGKLFNYILIYIVVSIIANLLGFSVYHYYSKIK